MSPRATNPAELILKDAVKTLGASSCTFYVRDPWWTDEMRLVFMIGVRHQEPMHGFLTPEHSKRVVTIGEEELFATDSVNTNALGGDTDPVVSELARKEPLFGDFVVRESVVSSARLICRRQDKAEAVLFVNFNHRIEHFDGKLVRGLRQLMKKMVKSLPSITRDVKEARPFPISQLLRILQPTEQLPAIDQQHGQDSLKLHLTLIVKAALEACDIREANGVGTIHLFDAETRVLRLAAHAGQFDTKIPRDRHNLNVDEGQGIVSWVALKRRSILIPNLAKSAFAKLYLPTRSGICSELAVPMLAGNELLGVLNLECTRKGASLFTPESVRAIWYAANQAATACRLFHQARVARERAKQNHTLLQICSEAPDRIQQSRPLDDLAHLACECLNADSCDIWKYDSQDQFVGAGATYAEFNESDPPRLRGWSNYVRKFKTPVRISYIKDKKRLKIQVWDLLQRTWQEPSESREMPSNVNPNLSQLDVNMELGMPIRMGNLCIGVAWLKYKLVDARLHGADTMAAAFGFAGQAALVLSCLQKQKEQKHASSVEGMTLLLRILRHETVSKIAGGLLNQMEQCDDKDSFFGRREDWIMLIGFLGSYVENLRWVVDETERQLQVNNGKVCFYRVVDQAIKLSGIVMRTPLCQNNVQHDLEITADEKLLQLLLFNLLHNAKKYTADEHASEPITVTAVKSDSYGEEGIEVRVDDAGYGFPKELLPRVFDEMWVHQDPAGKTAKGSGCGLYFCNLIVKAHGGIMSKPKDNERGGSTFTFFLPTKDKTNV